MKQEDFLKVDGFAKKMAEKIYAGIQSQLATTPLHKLMVATNIFGRGFSDGKIAGSFFHNPELDYWVKDKINEDVVKIWADTGKYYRKIYNDFTGNLHRNHTYEQLGIKVGFVTTKPYFLE